MARAHILILDVIPAAVHVKPVGRLTCVGKGKSQQSVRGEVLHTHCILPGTIPGMATLEMESLVESGVHRGQVELRGFGHAILLADPKKTDRVYRTNKTSTVQRVL